MSAGAVRRSLAPAFASRLRSMSVLSRGFQFSSPTARLGYVSRAQTRQAQRSLCAPAGTEHPAGSPPQSSSARALSAKTRLREWIPPPRSEPEVLPLPDGVDGSRMGLYEVIGTEGTGENGEGQRTVFGVHGPREYWLGGGGSLESAGGGSFAIVDLGGHQHKVIAGDVLYTNRIPGEVNTAIVLDKVVLVGSMLWSVFGRPFIPGAVVMATVESQTKSAKVMVTKFKKRKGYLRRKGHRQPITRIRVDSIDYEVPEGKLIVPHEVPYDPLRPPMPNNPRYL